MKRRLAISLWGLCLLLAVAAEAASELPPPEYDETRELIALVEGAAGLVAAQGIEVACAEFREPGSRWFQGETYLFVFDMEGDAVCHPARPNLEGRRLLELRDPYGKPIVRNFLRQLEGGRESGWVHYLWPQPDRLTFFWKTSHIRRATAPDGVEYIVGSGIYEMVMEKFFVVEQVNDAAELIDREGAEAFEVLRDRSSGFLFYDAYVFVLDAEGTMLVNVGSPQLEGSNVSDVKDVQGKPLLAEMLAATEADGSGWVDYQWPRPGDTLPASKHSFIRRVQLDGRTLLVGAGVYFD